MYKSCPLIHGQTEPTSVIRTTDGACIPFDPDNSDYQQYLAWCNAGNQPLPAEEQA